MGMLNKTGVAVAVATTDTIADLTLSGALDVCIEIKNTGANPLDAFVILAQATDAAVGAASPGNFVPILSVTGDYTTPKYPLQRATVDPTTLAAGASTMLFLKGAGISTLRLQASAGVGATTVEVHARAI